MLRGSSRSRARGRNVHTTAPSMVVHLEPSVLCSRVVQRAHVKTQGN